MTWLPKQYQLQVKTISSKQLNLLFSIIGEVSQYDINDEDNYTYQERLRLWHNRVKQMFNLSSTKEMTNSQLQEFKSKAEDFIMQKQREKWEVQQYSEYSELYPF